MKLPYVFNPMNPQRRSTRVVSVGGVEVGGDNPIRIQSLGRWRSELVSKSAGESLSTCLAAETGLH